MHDPSPHLPLLLLLPLVGVVGGIGGGGDGGAPLLPCLTAGLDLETLAASLSSPSPQPHPHPPHGGSPAGSVPAPVYGPYAVAEGRIASFPSLKAPHTASLWYPNTTTTSSSDTAATTFPFLSFAHGAGEGSILPTPAKVYPTLLRLVASYGFVVVAPDAVVGMDYTFYKEQLNAIVQCRTRRAALHPALAAADFARVGVFGHSMGAMASLVSAGGLAGVATRDYNITAAVSMHPCGNPGLHQQPALIDVPILFTAGSADVVCEDECARADFSAVLHPPRIFLDVAGIGHMDPTYQGRRHELQAVAYFLACHVRGEHCSAVYGPGRGDAICAQPFKLARCDVVNGTEEAEGGVGTWWR